jgi:predicted Zn-dependent protease
MVFPFRTETAEVLRWALARHEAWQARYYLALVEAYLGHDDRALVLMQQAGDVPAFAPFHAARAQLLATVDSARALADWRRAMALDPAEWRYGRAVAERLLREGRAAEAARLAGEYARRFPGRAALDVLYGRTLLAAGRAGEAVRWMDRVNVLPAEGAKDAHEVYREANLTLAVEKLGRRDTKGALALVARAREWPERLGAGKPYQADVDERLEDWLEAVARGGHEAAEPPASTGDDVTSRVVAVWQRLPTR